MSFITSVYLIIVGFFLWRGYRKGFASSLAQILSLVIAYPAAILLTNPLANFIFSHTTFTGMLVYFAAGSAIFFTVGLSVNSLIRLAARVFPQSEFSQQSSKIGGALIGGLVGGTVGLIAVYAINLGQKNPGIEMAAVSEPVAVNAVTTRNTIPRVPDPKPHAEKSRTDIFIESSAKLLVSTAAATAVDLALQDDTATHITKVFSQNPQKMLGHIQNLSSSGELKTLIADPDIQYLLKKGDSQALLDNWQFQHLMNNEDMQALLVEAEDTRSGKTSQQVAAEKMIEAWQHSDAIKNDPRVIAIITDAEFQQQLNSPNKFPLMMNPKLKQLTDIIFSNDYQAADSSNNDQIEEVSSAGTASPEAKKMDKHLPNGEPRKIYRWTDNSGKTHFSDEPEQLQRY